MENLVTKSVRYLLNILWVPVALLSLGLVVGGVYAINEGGDARDDIRTGLIAEGVTTSKDASIPNAPVDSAETARSQADVIRDHVLDNYGGSYAQLDRNDPNRAKALDGVTLRTGLMLSVLAFGVADFVVGIGWAFVLLGAFLAIVGVPTAFVLRKRLAEVV